MRVRKSNVSGITLRQTPTSSDQIWQTCTIKGRQVQRSGNFGCDRRSEASASRGLNESRVAGGFYNKNQTIFRQILISLFYQIRPRHMNPCPLERRRKAYSKIFRLWVICPPNVEVEWCRRPVPYSDQPKGRTPDRYIYNKKPS